MAGRPPVRAATAVVIVILSTAADLALGALDPRVRASGRP
jgi:ABC-type dipeptide/oligopeptide/nickel transport system permease component